MQDWRDYIIPVAIGVLLGAAALAWLVLTIRMEWECWTARLGGWWGGQVAAAERRAAERATRKAAPLLSIHLGERTVDYEEPDEEPALSSHPLRDEPSRASDGTSFTPPSRPSDDEAWTPEEILRQLALVKKIDKDGTARYLSKDKIAALVGLRAEEARAIIDEVRGVPPADAIKVKDAQGERMIAPLRTRARA